MAVPVLLRTSTIIALQDGMSLISLETNPSSSLFSLNKKQQSTLKSKSYTDPFSNEFSSVSTLTNLNSVYSSYITSQFFDGWKPSTVSKAVPQSYNQTNIDDFDYTGEGTGEIAEQQEDVAPSDPLSTTELRQGIIRDQSEQDRNLSGGITDNTTIGAQDANMDGPADKDILDNLVQPVQHTKEDVNMIGSESNGSNPSGAEAGVQQGTNITFDKEDVKGDLGVDTAYQSSLLSTLPLTEMNHDISPFIPTPHPPSSGSVSVPTSGVSANTDANRKMLEQAYSKMASLDSFVTQSRTSINTSYDFLKSIESELSSIDNIVYAKDQILTDDEKSNKADNRISRLVGVKTLLRDKILAGTAGEFQPSMLSLYILCDSLVVAINEWKQNPKSNDSLNKIQNFISPCISYVAMNTEKLKARIDHSNNTVLQNYERVIESFQDSDASERDASKVLKFDTDVSPSHNQFTINMKRLYNQEIQEALEMQRQSRSYLKAVTDKSYMDTNKIVSQVSMEKAVQQASNTLSINTDSILQKYPRAPSGVKTNSRRLNLLETPIATKQQTSVPYVNTYNESKVLFA